VGAVTGSVTGWVTGSVTESVTGTVVVVSVVELVAVGSVTPPVQPASRTSTRIKGKIRFIRTVLSSIVPLDYIKYPTGLQGYPCGKNFLPLKGLLTKKLPPERMLRGLGITWGKNYAAKYSPA
jgi:hypothetical protein